MKSLTGRRRFRVDDGKLVLQVEEQETYGGAYYGSNAVVSWRDATVGDISTHRVEAMTASMEVNP